jgi:hypothetical protein
VTFDIFGKLKKRDIYNISNILVIKNQKTIDTLYFVVIQFWYRKTKKMRSECFGK